MNIKELLEQFQENPIAYHRIYSMITKKVTTGILLSQLMYWDKQMKHQEFYKTDKDFCQELSMGMKEFRAAKVKLIKLEIITTNLKGVPAKTYYKVSIDKVIELISSMPKIGKLDCLKQANKNALNRQTIYTENTTKNTSDIATPLQSVVNYFYELKGWDYKEKKFKLIYARYTKPAKELLELCDGNIKEAKYCIKKVQEWADSRDLNWSIGTIFKQWYDIDKLLPKVKEKKPYFEGDRMFKSGNKWNVIMPNGEIKKFAGDFNKIEYK